MKEQTIPARLRPVLGWFCAAFVLVLTLKLHLASALDLYSDEIFYWWASTRLALAYSDLPFMTALLAGLGSGFEPATSIQVRSLFLLLGTLLPFLVFWVAKPITNTQSAWQSAILTLCLPLGGFMGLLAVPDVPIVFFGLAAIGFFERALRTDNIYFWLATGIAVALGLCTHYRFFLYPLAAILFLGMFKPAHSQWRNWKLWLAMAIASLGLIPIIWFNFSNQLSSASFYLVERHPWQFQATGLLHVFKQAGLVTPPLYVLFLFTLWQLYKQAKAHDRNAALLLAFAATNLSVYWILAPWTDADSTSIHWPLSGYFPLLIAAPMVLRNAAHSLSQRWGEITARRLIIAVPALGFAGTLVALGGVGSQAYQLPLQALIGPGVLSNKMAGWREFAAYSVPVLNRNFGAETPVIITDNYYTAAQVEFAGLGAETITLDSDKAVRDGRITQIVLWNKDSSGLDNYIGRPALFITEDSTLELAEKINVMTQICTRGESIEFLDELTLFGGDKRFTYYGVPAIEEDGTLAFPCPYPIQAWIDSPETNAKLSGIVNISGWAYNEDIGITTVKLVLDGNVIAEANYGLNRSDVVDVRDVRTDPNAPNLGFDLLLDTTTLTNGRHTLAIEIQNRLGLEEIYGRRTVEIIN